MWKMRIMLGFFAIIGLSGCSIKSVLVEISTLPASSSAANIRQISEKLKTDNSHTCNLPCPLKVENDNIYEISIDTLGYYPVLVKLDLGMALSTAVHLGTGKTSNGDWRVPLVIPLVPKKHVAPE